MKNIFRRTKQTDIFSLSTPALNETSLCSHYDRKSDLWQKNDRFGDQLQFPRTNFQRVQSITAVK
jgi:hypothetical protein